MEAGFVAELSRTVAPILAAQPVAVAYLHGSRARGRFTRLSDVDIALVTSEPLEPRERLRLELALEVELQKALQKEFDVRVINDAPLAVRGEVLRQGRRIYVGDNEKRIEFETCTRRPYLDFLPFLRRNREVYLAAKRERRVSEGPP